MTEDGETAKSQRKKTPQLKRNRPRLKTPPKLLIVCEGKNTETSYFRHFRLRTATVVPVGIGYNTISLVNKTVEIVKEESKRHETYDEIWCVFDRDDFPAGYFDNAIKMAERRGFHVAYSNQAFEYWVLLHFIDHRGEALPRTYYDEIINRAIAPYHVWYDGKRHKLISERLFNLMFGKDPKTNEFRYRLAIERSRSIYDTYDHRSPAMEESSTTMHILVEHLLEFDRY